MSDNDVNIKLDIQFQDTAQTLDKKLKELINQMKNKHIDITVNKDKLINEFNEMKNKYDTILRKINEELITPKMDSQMILKDIKNIKTGLVNLNKQQLVFIDDKIVKKIYELQTGLKETLKIVKDINTGTTTEVSTLNVKGLYNEMAKSQKTIFDLEKQKINASEELKNSINKQLAIVTNIQNKYVEIITQNKLVNSFEQEKLNTQKQFLKNQLEILKIKDAETQTNKGYIELSRLQNEEFKVRNQMIGVEENIKTKRLEQLNIILDQQQVVKNLITTNNLINLEKENELLQQRGKLLANLETKDISEINKARVGEQKRLYSEIETSLNKINILEKQSIGVSEFKSKELQSQIEKHQQIIASLEEEISKKGFTNTEKENELMQLRIELEEELNLKLAQRRDEELKLITDMQRNIENLRARYGSLLDKDDVKPSLDALQNSLTTISTSTDLNKVKNQFKDLDTAIKTSNAAMKITQKETMGIKEAFSQAFQKFPLWIGVSTVVMGAIHEVKNGIKSIIEYDSQLTNLKFTMDGTSQQFRDMGEAAHDFGKDLGANVNTVMGALQIYTNLNETIDSILEKSKAAVVLTNITRNDISKSADAIQGMIYQFDLASDSAMHLVDVMAKIGAETGMEFARSINTMTESISRGGYVAQEVGLTIEQYLAIVGTLSEQTRLAGTTISTGLNTIFSRITRVSDLTEEEISKIETAYKDLGVTIRNEQGEFEDMWVIAQRLSPVWNKMTNTQRSYIAELSAGIRQKRLFLGLMENMELITQRAADATEAHNFALERNDIYLDSIEGKLNKISTIKIETWRKLIDTEDIKIILDFFIDFMEVISATTTKVGALGSALGITFGVLAGFNKNVGQAIINDFRRFHTEWHSLNQESLLLRTNLNDTLPAVTNISNAFKALGTTMTVAKLAAIGLNAVIGMGLGLIIQKSIKLTHDFIHAEENRRKAMIETAKEIKTQLDEIKNIEKLINKKKELDEVEYKSTEQRKELNEVQKELAKLLPETTTGFTEEGEAIAENTDLLLANVKARKEMTEEMAGEVIAKAGGSVEKERIELELLLEEQQKYFDERKKLFSELTELEKKRELNPLDESISAEILDIEMRLKSLGGKLEKSRVNIAQLKEKIEEFEFAVNILNEGLDKTTVVTNEQTESNYNLSASVQEAIEKLKEEKDTAEELNKQFDEITSTISDYRTFLEEINSEEGLSVKSKERIIKKYIELLPYIEDEETLRHLIIDALQEEEKVAEQVYRKKLELSEGFYNKNIRGNKELFEKLWDYYGRDVEEWKTIADAKLAIEAELIKVLGSFWAEYYNSATQMMEFGGDTVLRRAWYDSSEKRLFDARYQHMLDIQRKMDDIVSKFKIDLTPVSLSKSSASAKEQYKAIADAYAEINLLLDKNNLLLQKNKVMQDLAGNDLKEKLRLMSEEIELHQHRQELLHQLNTQMRKEAKGLQKELEHIFVFEGSWDDNSMTITNLEAIEGKSKDIEEKFNRLVTIIKELPKASQEWWDILSEIDKLKLDKISIEFELSDVAVRELKNAISDLEYEFKLLEDTDIQSKMNNITEQVHYMEEQVKLATEELEKLKEKGFKEGSKEAELYTQRQEELTKRIQEGTLAINDYNKQLKDMQEQYRTEWIAKQNKLYAEQQERLNALSDIQEKIVAIIRKRGEEEKKALDEAHKAEMASLEDRHKARKEQYKEDLDEFKKIIQAKIDALDEQYAEEDYLEQLDKEREEASELQKQIDILSLDTSLTAKNKVIELRKKLADQNDKIAKLQQKKERDTLKKSLQDQIKDYEESTREKEKIADNLYENEKSRLEEEYEINKEYLERRYSDEKVYAEARQAIMRGEVEVAKGVFVDIYDAFVDFENKFGKGMGILGDIIRNDFTKELEKAQRAIEDLEYESRNLLFQYDSDYQPTSKDKDYNPPASSKQKPTSTGKLSDMLRTDYNKYVYYKELWEYANRDGNETAKNEIHKLAQELRNKYNIKSDLYNYDALKNVSYDDLKRLGYKVGGKITETGTLIAPFHGTQTNPEWIFNDSQLRNVLRSTIESTTTKLRIPTLSDKSIQQNITLQVDSLINVEGNLTKDILPQVKTVGNDILNKFTETLNKSGTRPAFSFG